MDIAAIILGFLSVVLGISAIVLAVILPKSLSRQTDKLIETEDARAKSLIDEGNKRTQGMIDEGNKRSQEILSKIDDGNKRSQEILYEIGQLIVANGSKTRELIQK